MNKNDKYFIHDAKPLIGLKGKIKKIYYCFQAIKERLSGVLRKPIIIDKKYKVSICAIFKNEAPYLREWIEFNSLVGVEHFYMYNNNSEDDYESVLKPYVDKGRVTLIQWPYNQKQMESYIDCINKFSSETNWLGFIDIDEFIVPKNTNNIYDFLKNFENRGAVNIYWRLYGSSGLINRNTDGLVTEDFTVCWPKYCDIGKCFYNTAFGFNPNSKKSDQLHHKFWANYKNHDIPPVNIFGHVCVGDRNIADDTDFPIQINHYFTKSYKEYAKKRAKGDVYFRINPHDEEYFYEHEMKCTSVDLSAYKYLIKLKLLMEKQDERDE
jgi:hypothetical protein